MAMIEYGPMPGGGFGTNWSTIDVGAGSSTIGLVAVDLNGDGTTEFVQFRQNGSGIGAICIRKPSSLPGYQVYFDQPTVLPNSHGGSYVAGRWSDGRGWIVRCGPSGPGPANLGLFKLNPAGDGLELAWQEATDLVNLQWLVADIDGDGDDELLVYSAAPQAGSGRKLLYVLQVSPTGLQLDGAIELDDAFFPVTAAVAADMILGRQAAVFLQEQLVTGQVRASVCLYDHALPPPAKYRLRTSSFEYDRSSTLIGWRAVSAGQGDAAAALVRVGRQAFLTALQIFPWDRWGFPSQGGPLVVAKVPAISVALLESPPGPQSPSLIHHLFDNNGRLGWAAFFPDIPRLRAGLAGLQDDLGQGPWAIGFFVAKPLGLARQGARLRELRKAPFRTSRSGRSGAQAGFADAVA